MSSPGNSGTISHAGGPFGAPRPRPNPLLGSPHRSPLRAEFRVQDRRGAPQGPARRVEFEKYVAGAGAGATEAGAEAKYLARAPPPSGAGMDETREGVIDRLLDRMSDTSRSTGSSSDEDVEVPLSYKPRVAGRV